MAFNQITIPGLARDYIFDFHNSAVFQVPNVVFNINDGPTQEANDYHNNLNTAEIRQLRPVKSSQFLNYRFDSNPDKFNNF